MSYESSIACKVLATTCCVCCRPLVDADSVDLGIGPICRKKYMKPEPGFEDSAIAFAVLAQSKLPGGILEKVASAATAREQANMLVYWASANIDDPEKVLSIAPALRLLGYSKLADKLVADRSPIQIRLDGMAYVVTTPYSGLFNSLLRNRRAVYLRDPRGSILRDRNGKPKFAGWSVPVSERRNLWNALTLVFPGILGNGPKGHFRVAQEIA